ncbi:hypothetical protein GGS24DRAFT_510000 [Hypoxylon argillaceum]|nr:hypothetical protein GGS24DRAFT_510000 [Hypoxylon argillaceum]
MHHPKPQRPCKRPFTEIDPDFDPDLDPDPLLYPVKQRLGDTHILHADSKTRDELKVSLPPVAGDRASRSASAPPQPAWEDGRIRCGPSQLLNESEISAWLVKVLRPCPRLATPLNTRPLSCPSTLDLLKGKKTPLSLAMIRQMPLNGGGVRLGSDASQSDPDISHPLYRSTLFNNGIYIDYSGRMISTPLRMFLDTQILKHRGSPQLRDEAVAKVIDVAEELADNTEGLTAKLMRTEMFPFDRPGIAEGGSSPWSTAALPNNAEYQYAVTAPKPDVHFGYPTNQRSSWSTTQSNVITHPAARPYTQPARGNTFPFVSVEMKSEAAGGTLYVAENQAAGSGSHCVNSLLWLLQQAGTDHDSIQIDTIAFTIALSHRQAVFYLHWYSEVDHRYYMSFLESYSSMRPADIRACNSTVKNILDYGLGQRKKTIGVALGALYPFPKQWKQARSAHTASSSRGSSIQDVGPRRKKIRRDSDPLEETPGEDSLE